ncbi:alpha-tubulin N-acetyltransferase 1-like [Metopolophium dirhodum]|uniref:alpha-tubulin N-acetyltransferase 1-like n=1 Tax=Metopolophium dirhodum TaxID=44670 RepID=UPI00298F43AB|nr:alpha-tubulin N-acetyltransferase 1-like [Metopolophium dirhodum]XP_060873365.1 alpha-tubulin N-acetyltransferase 1-like [Metopolophium dirhodum]
MEFNSLTNGEVLKIDNTLTAMGYENNVDLRNKMGWMIDEMGKVSAMAQELRSPITSAELLINSDHVLYMMIEHNTSANFVVVGILKTGWKKLCLYNKAVGSCKETMVYCLMDFYVHESRQHKGYGKYLIDYMLQDMHLRAKNLAIENPTKNLLEFMWKHFQLSKLVNQGNYFIVYEEFFDDAFNERSRNDGGNGTSASPCTCQPMLGRPETQKHHETSGEIVQGNPSFSELNNYYNPGINFVESQFKAANVIQNAQQDRNPVKRDQIFHQT